MIQSIVHTMKDIDSSRKLLGQSARKLNSQPNEAHQPTESENGPKTVHDLGSAKHSHRHRQSFAIPVNFSQVFSPISTEVDQKQAKPKKHTRLSVPKSPLKRNLKKSFLLQAWNQQSIKELNDLLESEEKSEPDGQMLKARRQEHEEQLNRIEQLKDPKKEQVMIEEIESIGQRTKKERKILLKQAVLYGIDMLPDEASG